MTNASFIGGNADAGLRACLADEYSHAVCVQPARRTSTYPRGAVTTGRRQDLWVRFPLACRHYGAGARPRTPRENARFIYKDIGDYSVTGRKAANHRGRVAPSVGISDWQRIAPDEHHDWLDQTGPSSIRRYMPLGSKEGKSKKSSKPETSAYLFDCYSSGIATKSGTDVHGSIASSRPRNWLDESRDYDCLLREKTLAICENRGTRLLRKQARQNDAPSKDQMDHSDYAIDSFSEE